MKTKLRYRNAQITAACSITLFSVNLLKLIFHKICRNAILPRHQKSTFSVQKKPVASGERIIPWKINGGKQLICPATSVHIHSFFPST